LEFGRKRYRFALACVEMFQSRIDGLFQAHNFQPRRRLRNPRAQDGGSVCMSQLGLHSGRDQNRSIQFWKNISCLDEYEVVLEELCQLRSIASTYRAAGVSRDPAQCLLECIPVRRHDSSAAYRERKISAAQLRQLLGYETQMEVDAFLKGQSLEGRAGQILTRSSQGC
jgi:hypothetical protein